MNRAMPREGSSYELRERQPQPQRRPHFAVEPQLSKEQRRLRARVAELQGKWESIRTDLPPQLSRRHIGMISIGGVVGTGLFIGSADALRNGGPIGALMGYGVMGSVVYCLCVSVGEMISFLPNVGGVVGLADAYVDRALGFSLGWAAWYTWSITLPIEIVAAAIVVQYWDVCERIPVGALTSVFLAAAVFVNIFPSRIYGEMEFWLSTLKVVTVLVLILSCLVIDLGAAGEFHGADAWKTPFAKDYQGIDGATGHFLSFWAVMMQAAFSFFGSEVPGIAAGEVIDATINVPRALRRVWLRITLFYMGSIFAAGLLFKGDLDIGQTCSTGTSSRGNSKQAPQGTGNSSPFVTIFRQAKWKVLPDMVNAAILISAWSAAASDIYVSSRYLFFLAKNNHAPKFLAQLIRFPRATVHREAELFDDVDTSVPPLVPPAHLDHAAVINSSSSSAYRYAHAGDESLHPQVSDSVVREVLTEDPERQTILAGPPNAPPKYVLPLASVFVSSSVGILAFMTVQDGGPRQAFLWMGQVTSVAALQSWIGMLFTYLRFWQGTTYAENNEDDPDQEGTREAVARIKRHRHSGQPFLALYAFLVCVLVLVTSGWTVFLAPGWRIADEPGVMEPTIKVALANGTLVDRHSTLPARIPTFLSSYVPIPIFILLTVGYKLVYQTKAVLLSDMTFKIGDIPEPEPLPQPRNFLERIWFTII